MDVSTGTMPPTQFQTPPLPQWGTPTNIGASTLTTTITPGHADGSTTTTHPFDAFPQGYRPLTTSITTPPSQSLQPIVTTTLPTSFQPSIQQLPSGLQVLDSIVGHGALATPGKAVVVHYDGTLFPSGQRFDSSLERGEPFTFTLGAGEVIPGWDEGIKGMAVGGKRTLIIPAALGYGDAGAPPDIPPGATLKFDVELLDVKDAPAEASSW